eukprot:CAMPEP_0115111002 /NCGR_PEP_ID=MMETSP0227-20121206/39755_1 /TAXON_ID=89957 /ORGANISM="Polarella glacialis, Strain CCMP 1383" /LENGTH=115 /DNA_ID=CAMNT_0002510235 /DNA_START=30 /DNA_END=377 /DNA_ORIENTATION=-
MGWLKLSTCPKPQFTKAPPIPSAAVSRASPDMPISWPQANSSSPVLCDVTMAHDVICLEIASIISPKPAAATDTKDAQAVALVKVLGPPQWPFASEAEAAAEESNLIMEPMYRAH